MTAVGAAVSPRKRASQWRTAPHVHEATIRSDEERADAPGLRRAAGAHRTQDRTDDAGCACLRGWAIGMSALETYGPDGSLCDLIRA